MTISYIEENTTITKEVEFEPENYIYLQKIGKEQNKSIDEIINELIRKDALNTFKTVITDTKPYTTSVYPYVIRPNDVWYGDNIKCTTTPYKYTYYDGYMNTHSSINSSKDSSDNISSADSYKYEHGQFNWSPTYTAKKSGENNV